MDALQHATTIYLHPNISEFGKKLAAQFPAESGLKGIHHRFEMFSLQSAIL